jgi:hypothetical protein
MLSFNREKSHQINKLKEMSLTNSSRPPAQGRVWTWVATNTSSVSTHSTNCHSQTYKLTSTQTGDVKVHCHLGWCARSHTGQDLSTHPRCRPGNRSFLRVCQSHVCTFISQICKLTHTNYGSPLSLTGQWGKIRKTCINSKHESGNVLPKRCI